MKTILARSLPNRALSAICVCPSFAVANTSRLYALSQNKFIRKTYSFID